MRPLAPIRRGDSAAGERGFIIVAVLWILGALSALVLVYLSYVTNTAMVVAANADRPQTEALVSAGVELAVYQLLSGPPDARPVSGKFDARVGPHLIAVTFVSEAARIDLNAASASLLAGLFRSLGARADAAESYADRVVAWRTRTKDDNDPETSFYRISGSNYAPRHGPFPQAEELWLVRGIPAAFIERAMPFVTTFSNQGAVSVREAAPQVVAALPSMTPERLQAILAQRGDPRIDVRNLTAMAGEGAGPAVSRAYRVTVAIEFEGGRRTASEAVVSLLDIAEEPYRVLSWRNLFDGDTAMQTTAAR